LRFCVDKITVCNSCNNFLAIFRYHLLASFGEQFGYKIFLHLATLVNVANSSAVRVGFFCEKVITVESREKVIALLPASAEIKRSVKSMVKQGILSLTH